MNSPSEGPILALGQRGQNGLPRRLQWTLPLSFPRLIFSFSNLFYLSTVSYSPLILLPFLLRHYVLFSTVAPAFTLQFVSFTSRDGCTAEDYQRTAEENGWDSEAYEEEDSVQLTKDEPGEVYKRNLQQALDQWTM